MHQSYIRPGSAAAAVPAIAGGEYSSDEILVERIAAGDKLAMQVLFAPRHPGRYREDPYVLCPQEAGCAGSGGGIRPTFGAGRGGSGE